MIQNYIGRCRYCREYRLALFDAGGLYFILREKKNFESQSHNNILRNSSFVYNLFIFSGTMGETKELSEQEADLYDRQIRLWGIESQKRYVITNKTITFEGFKVLLRSLLYKKTVTTFRIDVIKNFLKVTCSRCSCDRSSISWSRDFEKYTPFRSQITNIP